MTVLKYALSAEIDRKERGEVIWLRIQSLIWYQIIPGLLWNESTWSQKHVRKRCRKSTADAEGSLSVIDSSLVTFTDVWESVYTFVSWWK